MYGTIGSYVTENDTTVEIWQCDTGSPREDSNLGTFVGLHRRYDLPYEWQELSKGELNARCKSWGDVLGTILLEQRIAGDPVAAILPIYAYDHSGFFISTQVEPYWFHYSWDGGQIGYIFITQSKVREEYGWQRVTAKRKAKLEEYLAAEVKTYAQYVCGEVYGYTITTPDGDVESCGGYYGLDEVKKAAAEAAGVGA